eukprot:10595466-Ditylum_brightwellii.AAC.1
MQIAAIVVSSHVLCFCPISGACFVELINVPKCWDHRSLGIVELGLLVMLLYIAVCVIVNDFASCAVVAVVKLRCWLHPKKGMILMWDPNLIGVLCCMLIQKRDGLTGWILEKISGRQGKA